MVYIYYTRQHLHHHQNHQKEISRQNTNTKHIAMNIIHWITCFILTLLLGFGAETFARWLLFASSVDWYLRLSARIKKIIVILQTVTKFSNRLRVANDFCQWCGMKRQSVEYNIVKFHHFVYLLNSNKFVIASLMTWLPPAYFLSYFMNISEFIFIFGNKYSV